MAFESVDDGVRQVDSEGGDAGAEIVASSCGELRDVPDVRRERGAGVLGGAPRGTAITLPTPAAPGAVPFARRSAGRGVARAVHGRVSPGPS